jgi:hypothetical protein
LSAVWLSGVQYPPVLLKPPRRLTGVGHHAEDVVEFEHGQRR